MKIVGLCGGSGSGKSTVASFFSEYGFIPINTDKIYHELTSKDTECLKELVGEFGEAILTESKSLDRRKLAAVVFAKNADKEKHKALNRIAHKHVLSKVRELISEYEKVGAVAVMVDAPMLFESGFDKECDAVISVTADSDVRAKRIVERDGIPVEAALARISSQLPDCFLVENSDYNIYNDDISALPEKVEKIAKKILNE